MKETFINTRVTYALKVGNQFYLIENVPARVCKETGEQLFSPETVEHVYQIISGNTAPRNTIQTPVYDYSA